MLVTVGEEEIQDKRNIRLNEVDVGWAMAVAGLVMLIILALCLMARCRLSMFTRKRKRILKKKSVKEVKDIKGDAAVVKSDKPPAKKEVKEVKRVMAISKTNRQNIQTVVEKKKSKKDFIIEMIDSVLDPAAGDHEDETENVKCSLESIDRAGEEQMLRRASQGSVTLSLVFDMESDRPVFVKHKTRKK